MEIKKLYEVNGKEFDDEEKAKEYLTKCIEEEEHTKKLLKEKETRRQEVLDAEKTYLQLRREYYNDYSVSHITNDWTDNYWHIFNI